MLQSITTARIESLSEGTNQTASAGNRGDTTFSALMDKQQPLAEAATSQTPQSEKAKSQTAGRADDASSLAPSAVAESTSEVEVKPSSVTASSDVKSSKHAVTHTPDDGVDFLQHLQASLATPTELTRPTQSGDETDEGDSKGSTEVDSDGKTDKLKKSEKPGGKLLPPGDELQTALLPQTSVGMDVGESDSAASDEALEIATGEGTGQVAGNSSPRLAAGAKADSDNQTERSTVEGKVAGGISPHSQHAGREGKTVTREQAAASVVASDLTKSGEVQQEGASLDRVGAGTSTGEADSRTAEPGADRSSQTTGRTQPEARVVTPLAVSSETPMRGEFRHSVDGGSDGVANAVLVDDTALSATTPSATGEQTATQAHQEKAQLAKEVALKERAVGGAIESDPQLLQPEEGGSLPDKVQSHAASSGSDAPEALSSSQGDKLATDVRPLATPTHTPSSSSVPQTTSERGSEIYRELASVNMSSHSKAAPELAERLTLMIGQKWQEAELELEPRGMGKMTIQLSIGQDQQASVQFIVQQHHSREVVEQTLPRLKEMLAQQGIQLEQASVQQQASGQGQSGQAGQWSARTGGEGAQGQGHSRGQGGGTQSQPGESAGQNVSVRSRQAAGIDFYA